MTQTTVPVTGARCDEKRAEFLLEVYRQTSAHLGRHILGVWQCVGVVGAALIVFAQEKDKPGTALENGDNVLRVFPQGLKLRLTAADYGL